MRTIPPELLRRAFEIIGRRDPGDVPFVALVLHLGADGIVGYDDDYEELTRYGYRYLKPKEVL